MKLSCVSENLGPVKIYYKDDLRNGPAITRDTFQISEGLDCKDEYFSQDVLIHNTMMSNWLPGGQSRNAGSSRKYLNRDDHHR